VGQSANGGLRVCWGTLTASVVMAVIGCVAGMSTQLGNHGAFQAELRSPLRVSLIKQKKNHLGPSQRAV
jgi:hypothetical protein